MLTIDGHGRQAIMIAILTFPRIDVIELDSRVMDGWVERYRRWAGWAVYVSSFGTGLVSGDTQRNDQLDLIFLFLVPTAIWFWCALDAKTHGKVFVHGFGIILMWTWPLSTAAYFVWTRGKQGLGQYLLRALVAFMVAALGVGVGTLF
jgi:hypothetical protein